MELLCDKLQKIVGIAQTISDMSDSPDIINMADEINSLAFSSSTAGCRMENRLAYYRLAIEMLGFTRNHEETLDYEAPPLMSVINYDLKTRFFNNDIK